MWPATVRLRSTSRVAAHENNSSRLHCNICASSTGNSNIRRREDWCIVEIGSAIRPIGVSHLTCRIVTYEANRKYSYMDDGVIAISSDRIGWSRWKEGSGSYCTNWLSERRAAQRCQPECRTLPFVCRYLHQGTAVPNANFIPINRFTWNQNCDLDKPGGAGAYSPRHHPVQFPEMARAHGALT